MKTYEYKVVHIPTTEAESRINNIARHGWRLVACNSFHSVYFFERDRADGAVD